MINLVNFFDGLIGAIAPASKSSPGLSGLWRYLTGAKPAASAPALPPSQSLVVNHTQNSTGGGVSTPIPAAAVTVDPLQSLIQSVSAFITG